jgi:hypothetical protein
MTRSLTITRAGGDPLCSVASFPAETVLQLKSDISSKTGLDRFRIRLAFNDTVLDDDLTVDSYSIPDGSALLLALRPAPRSFAPPAARDALGFIADHPDSYIDFLNSNLATRHCLTQNPAIVHAIGDSDHLREQLALFSSPATAAHAARAVDHQFAALESLPGGLHAANRALADVEAPAGAPFCGTRIARKSDGPSQAPLPCGPARPSARALIGGILRNLARLGVDLPALPGLAVLRELEPLASRIPEEQIGEWERRFRVQLKQLRAMGFTDTVRSIEALIDAQGNVGIALASLETD